MLPVFPASSLDSSILTSVLLGLVVAWLLQETLGWTFTGLVVPGYLASILLIQPETALVITLESLITWAVVLAVSDRVPAWWPWAQLFGRDRFFAFLATSVGVRVALESGGFVLLGELLGLPQRALGHELHSLGLVVVPLMSHAMWRSGLSGLPRIVLPVLIVWAILRFAILPLTNLSLSSFQLTYEDLARDFVASPRHYIVLLIGAALGSHVNLRWGWDFGGIIMPGLLALCWDQPERLLATLSEAVLIAGLYGLVVRLPGLSTVNLTGGRPLVLAYLIGYLVKFVLGWGLGGVWPGFEVRSLFGFGYLLSSILALRIVKHGEIFRSTVPLVLTSFCAAVLANTVGYGLSFFAGGSAAERRPSGVGAGESLVQAAWDPEGEVPELTTAMTAPGLWQGAGWGALRVSGSGSLIVVAEVGPVALAEAAMVLADAMGARATLLCVDRCEARASELGAFGPVLRVTAGGADRLAVPGESHPAIRVDALGVLVPKLSLVVGDAPSTLTLSATTRMAVVAGALGHPPEPWREPLAPEPSELAQGAEALRGSALSIFLYWAMTGDRTAMVAASGRARALGATVRGEGDYGAFEAPGWTVLVDRRVPQGTLVHVPLTREEPGALPLALALGRSRGAGVWFLDSLRTSPDVPHPADQALFQLIDVLATEVGSETGDRAEPVAITVREVPEQLDPGADVVLSRGRLFGDPSPLQTSLLLDFKALGLSVLSYDGAAERASCTDATNPARSATAALFGEHQHITAFFRAAVSRHLVPYTVVPPLLHARSRGALPELALDDLAVAHAPSDTADHALAVGTAIQRGRAIYCDPWLGCRWVAQADCEAGQCSGTLLPLLPPVARPLPGAPPLSVLAFSAGPLRFEARAR